MAHERLHIMPSIRTLFKSPARISLMSFSTLIFIGTLLLMLPAAVTGRRLGLIDALFTATSASCVTGLSVVDTGSTFTTFGQAVIVGLIQVGGLGIMTLSTLFIMLAGKRPSLTGNEFINDTFSHSGIDNISSMVRRIILVTLAIELGGAAVMFFRFYPVYPLTTAIWYAVFHSISAFCNAGFSTFSDSFTGFQGDVVVNTMISLLIILGGIGFIVMFDCFHVLRLKNRRWTRLSLHAKIVLFGSAALLLLGTALFFFMEMENTLKGMPPIKQVMVSFFHAVSARTAGFNTVSIGALANETLFFLMLLMFIGAAPGSCGGGIKVTTALTLILHGTSRFRGNDHARLFNRTIPERCIGKAIGVVLLSMLVIFMATMLLLATELGDVSHIETRGKFLEILFEAVSAFGTVGLSTGLTGTLSGAGKLIVSMVMFMGRLGPLVIALGIQRQKIRRVQYAEENIMIG